jgi:hypothetical protein
VFQYFIRQNSHVLGIVLEFDDVVATVVAAHQVGLRSAAHATNMLDRQQHGGMLITSSKRSKRFIPVLKLRPPVSARGNPQALPEAVTLRPCGSLSARVPQPSCKEDFGWISSPLYPLRA